MSRRTSRRTALTCLVVIVVSYFGYVIAMQYDYGTPPGTSTTPSPPEPLLSAENIGIVFLMVAGLFGLVAIATFIVGEFQQPGPRGFEVTINGPPEDS